MSSPVAGLQAEYEDNMGAGAARAAAEALIEAAEHVRALTGSEGRTLLVGLQQRINEATEAAERLYERQLSGAMIRQAHRREDYADGWNDCLAARRGLHAV
jgi:hypothetical protein